jgi:thioredoxin-related protein
VYHEAPGKKDISIIFVLADWCGWCKRLKSETLADTSVIRLLCESYNIVNLNPDEDSLVVCGDSTVSCRMMAREVLGVRGFPTMVFFNHAGDIIGPIVGYKPAATFIDILERMKDGEY